MPIKVTKIASTSMKIIEKILFRLGDALFQNGKGMFIVEVNLF